MKTEKFFAYAGFRFIEESKHVSIKTAEKELLGKHQRFYSNANMQNEKVVLQAESLLCPHCNHKIPAYRPFLSSKYLYRKIPKTEVQAFLNPQFSFEDFGKNRTLHLQDVERKSISKNLVCPHCFYEGVRSERKTVAFIKENKQCITVGLELSLVDLINCKWLPQKFFVPMQSVFETITFNLRNGHVFLRLQADHQKPIATFDITNMDSLEPFEDALLDLFSWHPILLHRLKGFFKAHKMAVPFQNDELDLEAFILLTRFQGYERNFYDRIPFLKGTLYLDASFKGMAKHLRKSPNVPKLLANTNLPKIKSVRRLLFQNSAFLFFENEMEFLWELFNDANLFCRALKSVFFYEHLYELRDYPDIREFYEMYLHEKGKIELVTCIEKTPGFAFYAIPFLMKRKDLQKSEMQKWNTRYIARASDSLFSVQRHLSCCYQRSYTSKKPISIRPYTINGYVFCMLKRKKEYEMAAKDLQNCLKDYIGLDRTVVGICKNNKYVGAIEVCGKEIIQNFAFNNTPMEENTELFVAFKAWTRKFHFFERNFT